MLYDKYNYVYIELSGDRTTCCAFDPFVGTLKVVEHPKNKVLPVITYIINNLCLTMLLEVNKRNM